ncbi:hypothetical protein PIB30_061857 [Stylosanthes scabra]|uniref:Uncharacterized protein n=1 Tax=Stylosanthes scabra TaxID=79078 RepID=A0ABU6VK76_9FABA|nr:hypothetical protein [Stylosanthes scabra]
MALSSSTSSMLDEHCFRTMFNQNLFEELVCRKKVTPEVTFDLEDDEYPAIKEQIALRGWRRLASPRTKINKLHSGRNMEAEFWPTSKTNTAEEGRTHSIGEDVRAEELIEDNIAVIAQGMQGKGKLAFPSTIFKLCKDAQVPMHRVDSTRQANHGKAYGNNKVVGMCKYSSRMKKKKISQCLSLKGAMRNTMIKGSTNTFSHNISNLK